MWEVQKPLLGDVRGHIFNKVAIVNEFWEYSSKKTRSSQLLFSILVPGFCLPLPHSFWQQDF